MVTYAYNSRIWEVEAGGLLKVKGQTGINNEFQDSQDHITKIIGIISLSYYNWSIKINIDTLYSVIRYNSDGIE